jgi:nitroreductase
MELYDVMRTTPATRAFAPEPVAPEVVHRMLDNARFAPSGGNRQGWRVIMVDDPEVRRGLRDLYALSWREYVAHVADGKVPFAPGPDGRWTGPAVDLEQARATPAPNDFADNLHTVPVLLVLCVELGALAVTDNGLDRQSIVGGASVYPFAHNLLLAARNEGLGGVMTTVICRQEPAVRDLLGLPGGVAVAGVLAIGRPERQVTRLSRRSVEELAVVDRWDGPPFTV